MREIKFRGKRIDNGEWVYGKSIFNCNGNYAILDNVEYNPTTRFQIQEEIEIIEVIPESVGQMWQPTNGIECYGGDLFKAFCTPSDQDDCIKKERIVKIIETNRGHSVVVWHHGTWWAYSKMDFTSFKHIGNIFDNPELLNN